MPGAPPSPERYRERAAERVEEVTRGWTAAHGDLSGLMDRVLAGLAEEASNELRQVHVGVRGDLEQALETTQGTEASLPRDQLERMVTELTRAERILSTYLDRTEAAKLLIRLESRRFELGSVLEQRLARSGLQDASCELSIDPVTVLGDPDKLLSCLTYVAGRFNSLASPDERLSVRLSADPDRVEGFIGLVPSHLDATTLAEPLEQTLDIEAAGIDMPYVRAVIERHGGSIQVEQTDQDGLGYAFALPRESDSLDA